MQAHRWSEIAGSGSDLGARRNSLDEYSVFLTSGPASDFKELGRLMMGPTSAPGTASEWAFHSMNT